MVPGLPEILIVLLIVVLLFGAKRIPDLRAGSEECDIIQSRDA